MAHRGTLLLMACLLAGSVCAGTTAPDLYTPGIEALRGEYKKRCEELAKRHRADMQTMLEKRFDEARQKQARARVSGNTTALAVAANGIKIYQDALAELKQRGTFDFAGRVRRENADDVESCRRLRKAGEDAMAATIRMLDGQYADKLQPELAKQDFGELGMDERRALWAQLLVATNAPPRSAAGATDKPEVVQRGGATNGEVRASSGQAQDWVELARIDVTLKSGMEVVALPMTGLTKPVEVRRTGLESGQPWQAKIAPRFTLALPTGATPAFRIRNVPGMRTLDVVGWPAQRNDWHIELRVRALSGGVSRHACLLDVDAAAETTPLAGGEAAQ